MVAKVLMVASWDWTLDKFRLALAESLREEGYEVVFVCARGQYVDRFQERGFRWVEWRSKRRRVNPFSELRALWALADIYERERPDVIHHDTLKPNLYGPIADWLNKGLGRVENRPVIVNTFMGLGYVFSNGVLPGLLRAVISPFLRFSVNRANVHVVFSNSADRSRLSDRGILRHERVSILMSEFVDTDTFRPFTPEQDAPSEASERRGDAPVALMAVRLLWAKGVGEFAEAARILERRRVDVRFWLAGEPDRDSAGFVPESQLRAWEESGTLEWLGYQTDMPTLLNQSDIAVLPTKYNEGMPRFLVEASACGLPVVTTDIEACRRVVDDGITGFIVPSGSSRHIADAIERLVGDRKMRREMADAARSKAQKKFDRETGVEAWKEFYAELTSTP